MCITTVALKVEAVTTYATNLSQSANNIVNKLGGKFSVGSTTPTARLSITDVAGTHSFAIGSSTGSVLWVDKNGNVGLNNVNPSTKLDIRKDMSTYPTTDVFGHLELRGKTNTDFRLALGVNTSDATAFIQSIQNNVVYRNLLLQPLGANVGIGTTSPSQVLSVAGKVYTTTGIQFPDGSLQTTKANGTIAVATTSPGVNTVTNGYATSTANLQIPANTVTASSTITFKGNFNCDNSSNGDRNCEVYIKDSTGGTLTVITVDTDQAISSSYNFNIECSSNSTVNAWLCIGGAVNFGAFKGISINGGSAVNTTSTINLSSATTLQVVFRSTGTLTTTVLTNYIIKVTP